MGRLEGWKNLRKNAYKLQMERFEEEIGVKRAIRHIDKGGKDLGRELR